MTAKMTKAEFKAELRQRESEGADVVTWAAIVATTAGVEWLPEMPPEPEGDVLIESRAGSVNARVWTRRWGGPIWQGVGHDGAASWSDLIEHESPVRVYVPESSSGEPTGCAAGCWEPVEPETGDLERCAPPCVLYKGHPAECQADEPEHATATFSNPFGRYGSKCSCGWVSMTSHPERSGAEKMAKDHRAEHQPEAKHRVASSVSGLGIGQWLCACGVFVEGYPGRETAAKAGILHEREMNGGTA